MQLWNTSKEVRAIWQHCWATLFIGFEELSLEYKLQETTWDDHRKSVYPLVNPHCPVPWHCCHFPAETEPHLHGLPVLLSEVEWCPAAHEVRETEWNEPDGTDIHWHPLVVYHINWYIFSCVDNTQNKEVNITQLQVSMSGVPMQQVCPERCIRQAAKNALQPHCLCKPIAVHATMKHLKGGQGNLTTLLGHTLHWV